jgi:small-conductance mechanosensitive channel
MSQQTESQAAETPQTPAETNAAVEPTAEISTAHTHDGYGHSHPGGELPHDADDHGTANGEAEQSTPDVPDTAAELTPDTAADAGSGFDIQALANKWGAQALEWLQSIPFLAQVGAIILAILLAPIIASIVKRRVPFLREKPTEGRFLNLKSRAHEFKGFIKLIVQIGLLAGFAAILKSQESLGEDWLVRIAIGLTGVVLLHRLIKTYVTNSLLKTVITWVSLPVVILLSFGWFDDFMTILDNTALDLGDITVSAAMIARVAIFGGLLFWIGRVFNAKGQAAISNQKDLDVGTRAVFGKVLQLLIYGVLFILLMTIAEIPLSGLVVLISALMLGIGLGLQPIAANFVSGLIILLDRTIQIGDFVELPDGQQGYVEALNMRQAVIETTDGKDIMVPNVTFIEETYQNWTQKDPRQRYEVYFQVEYGTDIDKLEELLIPAISANPKVLQEPEEPDLELREFAENGIKFAIEFWVEGIDDGENKFTSDLNYVVWRTLKKNGIKMPLPQREVRNLN